LYFRHTGYIAVRYDVIHSAKELLCGDHISWPIEIGLGVLRHHAIVLASKGDRVVKVIHVTEVDGEALEYEVAEELVDIGDVIQQGNLWRYEYEPDKCYDLDVVIERAKAKRGRFKYDPLENNCEHYARWCKNGENTSVQATAAKWGVAASLTGTVAVGALIVRRYLGI